jgi:HEAT repeat protein
MNAFAFRGLGRVLVAAALALFAAPIASAHGGLFRGPGGPMPLPPPPPGNPNAPGGAIAGLSPRAAEISPVPGSAPSLAFSEERWEFWWEFNHDEWVNLRPTLRTVNPLAGGTPFTPVDGPARAQVLLPALIELLRDSDEQVRSAACYSLARLDDPSTLPYLSNAAVSDSSLPVRTHAITALGLARNPKAVERLKTTFYDEHTPDEVRAMAAVALGISGLPEASAVLRDALAAGFESRLPYPVRTATFYAFGLTQDPGNAPFLRSLMQAKGLDEVERALVVESIGRLGDRAANPILLDALGSKEMPVRRSAAIALGVVARPEDVDVIKALEKAADDDADSVVRSFAEISLGRIASNGAPQVVERLRARLKSSTARQRSFVALALGISGYDTALPDLLAQFRTEGSTQMRGALAIAISLLDQKEAVKELHQAFLEEKDPLLRGYLAYALGRLGDQEIAKTLKEMVAKEKDPQLVYWSALGLALMGDRTITTWLEELYSKGGAEQITRSGWLHAIGKLGDKADSAFLIQVATSKTETDLGRAFATSSLGLLCDEDRVPRTALFSKDHNYTVNLTFVPELYYLF